MSDEFQDEFQSENSATATAEVADAQPYVDLVRGIVTNMVSQPDQVEVTADNQGRTLVIEISVATDDMGKVIGKGGRNISSIRSVTRAAGLRHHERVQVELLEVDE